MEYPHYFYWMFSVFQSNRKKIIGLIILGGVLSAVVWGFALLPSSDVDTYQEHSVIVTHEQHAEIINSTDVYSAGDRVTRTYLHDSVSNVSISTRTNSKNAVVNGTKMLLSYEVTERQTGSVFYTNQTVIISENETSGQLNITDIRQRVGVLQDEFRQSGQVNVYLDTVVSYSYTNADGVQNTLTQRQRTPVSTSGTLTVIPFEDVTVSRTSGTQQSEQGSAGDIIAFIITVVTVILGVLYYQSNRKNSEEWSRIAERTRYSDWFTQLNHSNVTGNPTVMYPDTLGGLVDIAIEVRKRVLWDKENDEYLVIADGMAYVYGPDLEDGDTPSFLMFGLDDGNGGNVSPTQDMGFGHISKTQPGVESDLSLNMDDIEHPPDTDDDTDTPDETDDPFGGYRN